MNCAAFERLLDERPPDQLPAEALAHARTCEACARSLARARSLEAALAAHFASDPDVPAGFADRVLARVERGEAQGVRWLALPEAMPWWTRAAAEPGVVLAMATVALAVWQGDRWLAAARVAWAGLAAVPERVGAWLTAAGFAPLGDVIARAFAALTSAPWSVQMGVALGIAPFVVFAAALVWRAGERLVETVAANAAR